MCERQVGWMHIGKKWREMYSRRRESSFSSVARSTNSVNGWTCFIAFPQGARAQRYCTRQGQDIQGSQPNRLAQHELESHTFRVGVQGVIYFIYSWSQPMDDSHQVDWVLDQDLYNSRT